MNSNQWQQVKTLVEQALELRAEDRERFIVENAGDDHELLKEVFSLIEFENKADGFIETPAYVGRLESIVSSGAQQLKNGDLIGRYRVLELIGEGGMGEVYLAEDGRLRRKVAVKILPPELAADQERLFRFEQEAQAASALNHPNIITIYEIGESDGLNFIATEYIQGETLHERLRRDSLPLASVLDIARQMSSALQAAHQAGIVHRDIKPENIMIRPDGIVKVLDFGIAKLTDQNAFSAGPEARTAKKLQTNPGIVIGTASYMSPEQARGTEVDARTDIWSLGVVLYEMVGGRAPFKGETLTDTIVAIIEKDPPPLRSVTSRRIPGKLEAVIRKALEKEPSRRFQTTGEILVDLDRIKKNIEQGETAVSSMYRDPPASAAATEVYEKRPTAPRTVQRRIVYGPVSVVVVAALIAVLLGIAAFALYRSRAADPSHKINSLAVLPLRSLDAEIDYLGLGVADAIIRRLSRAGQMHVRPTSSVRHYLHDDVDSLAAARALNVDAVLDGTVQRSDDRLRVSVSLLRASDGEILWADSFDMRSADVFVIQDKVAEQVASRLSLQLDPEQQERLNKGSTSDPAAYDYYVKGISSLDLRRFGADARAQLEATIDLFRKAVEKDHRFALAHAQLGYCYAWMGIFIDPKEDWLDRAKDQINIAESLDSRLAETHMTRYLIYFSRYENFQIAEAVRELRLAQQIDPNAGHDELSNLYQHLGLEDLSEIESQKALAVDPTSEYVKNTILGNYRIVKLFDKWAAANQTLLNGRTQPNLWMNICQGRIGEADRMLAEQMAKAPNNPELHARMALLLAQKRDFAGAEREIKFVVENSPAKDLSYHHVTYDFACVYAMQGKTGESIRWLRETVETGFPSYPLFLRDNLLDPIRETPEFQQFMAEMKDNMDKARAEFSE